MFNKLTYLFICPMCRSYSEFGTAVQWNRW